MPRRAASSRRLPMPMIVRRTRSALAPPDCMSPARDTGRGFCRLGHLRSVTDTVTVAVTDLSQGLSHPGGRQSERLPKVMVGPHAQKSSISARMRDCLSIFGSRQWWRDAACRCNGWPTVCGCLGSRGSDPARMVGEIRQRAKQPGTVGMVAYTGRAPRRLDAHGHPGTQAVLVKKQAIRAAAS